MYQNTQNCWLFGCNVYILKTRLGYFTRIALTAGYINTCVVSHNNRTTASFNVHVKFTIRHLWEYFAAEGVRTVVAPSVPVMACTIFFPLLGAPVFRSQRKQFFFETAAVLKSSTTVVPAPQNLMKTLPLFFNAHIRKCAINTPHWRHPGKFPRHFWPLSDICRLRKLTFCWRVVLIYEKAGRQNCRGNFPGWRIDGVWQRVGPIELVDIECVLGEVSRVQILPL